MNRLFWVAVVYATRPMLWLLALVLGIEVIVVHWNWSDQLESVRPDANYWSRPVRSVDKLREAVEAQSSPIAISYDDVANSLLAESMGVEQAGSTDDQRRQRDVALGELEFPNLTAAVRMGGWQVEQSTIEQLATIAELQSISLAVAADEPLDLSALARLQRLEVLDLGWVRQVQSLDRLRDCRELHTLAIKHVELVNSETMSQVASLPSLKTLYLPDIRRHARSFEAVEKLTGSNSLHTVRFAIPLDQSEELTRLSDQLPGISVESSLFNPFRHLAFLAILWTALVVGMLGTHLSGQFVLPQAELTPGYKASHRCTLFLMLIGLLALLSALAVYAGMEVAPAAAAIACAVTGSVAGSVTAGIGAAPPRRLSVVTNALAGATCLGLGAILFLKPMIVEEYLTRSPYWVRGLLWAASALFSVRLVWLLNGLCRERYAIGSEVLLSIHDLQRASLAKRLEKRGSARDPLEKLGKLLPAVGGLAMLTVILFLFFPVDWLPQVRPQELATGCMVVALLSVMLIAASWWQRVPFMASMIPRPPGRATQMSQLFLGVARDFVNLLPIGLAIAISVGSVHGSGTAIFAWGFLTGSVLGGCYACLMWSLPIRTVWGLVALVTAAYTAVIATTVSALMMGARDTSPFAPSKIALAGALLAVVSLIAVVSARRRFNRLEWAKLL